MSEWGAPDGDWLTDMRLHAMAHLLFGVYPDVARFGDESNLIRQIEALRIHRRQIA